MTTTEDKYTPEEVEDLYRELSALIRVYAGVEKKGKEMVGIRCASCKKSFRETVSEHLVRHLGDEFGWTSTPPPVYE